AVEACGVGGGVRYFLFQAADGVRDGHVTGVQRVLFGCVLEAEVAVGGFGEGAVGGDGDGAGAGDGAVGGVEGVDGEVGVGGEARSEERRVGKEGRARRGGRRGGESCGMGGCGGSAASVP